MYINGTTYDNPPDEDATLLKKKRQRIKKDRKVLKHKNKKTVIQDQTISSSSEVSKAGYYCRKISPHLNFLKYVSFSKFS
jgi:beta-galactosidase/beta-glucuronidase